MIKSHVLYQLSYGLSHSTRALKGKEGPASSSSRTVPPRVTRGTAQSQRGYCATVM